MQSQLIKISKIKNNSGQIEGLPKNPRLVIDEKFEKLVKSIQEDPEMLELRELIVYPFNDEFIVIAGNMRLKAMKQLNHKECVCKVLPIETTPEKLKAYTIKDNLSYGAMDWDVISTDWEEDKEQLEEWGLDLPSFESEGDGMDGLGTEFSLPDGDKAPFQQMTFTLADEQAIFIKNAIDSIKQSEEYKYMETMGNENGNGNALYLLITKAEKTPF